VSDSDECMDINDPYQHALYRDRAEVALPITPRVAAVTLLPEIATPSTSGVDNCGGQYDSRNEHIPGGIGGRHDALQVRRSAASIVERHARRS
jgi:hypothetical protein